MPAGLVSTTFVAALIIISGALFIFAAWKLNQLAFILSFPTLLILLGYSLGGGPATELAASRRCAGLILDRAFTSAFRVMTHVRLLPFDKFVVLEKLPRVTCPVLVIHGTADEVIPVAMGRRLAAILPPLPASIFDGRTDDPDPLGLGDVRVHEGGTFGKGLARFPNRPLDQGVEQRVPGSHELRALGDTHLARDADELFVEDEGRVVVLG